jgi:exopolysaccharide biosynthesis polyprenyl glycosylphosphotransferase
MLQGKTVTFILLLLDAVAVVFTYYFMGWTRGLSVGSDPMLAALPLLVLMHVVAVYLIEGYSPRTDMMSVTYTSLHTIALLFVLLFTFLLTYVFFPAGFPLQTSRLVIAGAFVLLIPITLSYRRVLYQQRQQNQQQRYFMFLGSPQSCLAFKEECQKTGMKQSVLYATHETFVPGSVRATEVSTPPFGDVAHYLAEYEHSLDAIILRESSQDLPAAVAKKLMELHFSGVPTYTLELFHEVYWRKIPLYRLNQTWLFQEGFQIAREPVFERLKRLSDIVLALFGLLLALPFLPLVAFAIWFEDRGPVFFRQARVGRNRVLFDILKLRSMRVNSGGDDYTRAGDTRITRIGKFLRNTRLDEVPQLWNVLIGDMSLIGPRAEWVKLVDEYEKKIPCYHFRHLVKPGITGWAQVNYNYGENLEDTLRKLEYDLYYIRYFSFILDASIVLKTIHIMLFGKGR